MDILKRKVSLLLLFFCVDGLRPSASTFVRLFLALSVNLSTLFLGKPPMQFTSTKLSAQLPGAHLTIAFLESAEGREWP